MRGSSKSRFSPFPFQTHSWTMDMSQKAPPGTPRAPQNAPQSDKGASKSVLGASQKHSGNVPRGSLSVQRTFWGGRRVSGLHFGALETRLPLLFKPSSAPTTSLFSCLSPPFFSLLSSLLSPLLSSLFSARTYDLGRKVKHTRRRRHKEARNQGTKGPAGCAEHFK